MTAADGASGQPGMLPPGEVEQEAAAQAAAELDAKFERHFAECQFRTDQFGTSVGALVYLSLIPSLMELGRRDLAAAAIGCSLMSCLWPLGLARSGRSLYATRRDFLLFFHFLFHYGIGAQLARYVRLSNKLEPASPASFLGSFILSSTVLWQSLDALMYRMRCHRFVLLKPLILLAVLPLERSLCQQSCDTMPGMARHFHEAAEMLDLLLAPFRPLPQPLAVNTRAATGAVLSCTKIQLFLLALLSWVVPAFVLQRLERQMFKQFAAQHRHLLAAAAPASGQDSPVADLSGSGSSSPASSTSPAAARPGLRHRMHQARQRWQLQWVHEHLQRTAHAAPAGQSEHAPDSRPFWDTWCVPLLLAGLCWHAIDTLLW